MAYEKQIWKDRQVQYPNRYVDQNGNILQLERSPGTVTENGSLFNAKRMNHVEDGIEASSKTTEGLKGTILWTNPNPASEFETQNITLSSSDYDVLEIYYVDDVTTSMMNTVKTKKGYGTNMSYMSDSSICWWTRKIEYKSDTEFSISNCILVLETKPLIDNAKCVPLFVVGYKTGLFN